jgi:hypothetical protein
VDVVVSFVDALYHELVESKRLTVRVGAGVLQKMPSSHEEHQKAHTQRWEKQNQLDYSYQVTKESKEMENLRMRHTAILPNNWPVYFLAP